MAYDWIQLFPEHSPSPRQQYAMAWDGTEIVLFGGTNRVDPVADRADTWTWNGTDWTLRSPAHSPGGRWSSGAAYDAGNGQVVIFGGSTDEATIVATDETWVWDGTDWTQLSPASSPSARCFTNMCYDEVRGEVVLWGGTDGGPAMTDTWIWDGADWTELTPVHAPTGNPPPALAWDQSNGVVVGWGGTGTDKTWTWDGTDWTALSPTNQPSGPGSNIYDELAGLVDWRVGGEVLEFGGRSRHFGIIESNQTWSWDGTDWTKVFPAHTPIARSDIMLAYDFTRDQILLLGGEDISSITLGDTWIYADAGPFTLHLET